MPQMYANRGQTRSPMKYLFFSLISLIVTGTLNLASATQLQTGNAFNSSLGSGDPPVTVGGGWYAFTWQNGPNAFDDQGAFTFTSASTTQLTITDLGVDGDRFSIYDNGVLIGTSSVPSNDGYDNESLTYDQALADYHYSHGYFDIAPGANSITIDTIQSATGYPFGGGALEVQAVPEPSALALLGLGVMSLAAKLRGKIQRDQFGGKKRTTAHHCFLNRD